MNTTHTAMRQNNNSKHNKRPSVDSTHINSWQQHNTRAVDRRANTKFSIKSTNNRISAEDLDFKIINETKFSFGLSKIFFRSLAFVFFH